MCYDAVLYRRENAPIFNLGDILKELLLRNFTPKEKSTCVGR